MSSLLTHSFVVAGHRIVISFAPSGRNTIELLPSFSPFRETDGQGQPLVTLLVDDDVRPATEKKLVRTFDTGNGDTRVYQLPDGGYQFIIKDIYGRDCCLLLTNRDFSTCRCALNGNMQMRAFGLNDAVMLAYAFASSFHQTLLIHASCIAFRGYAYPFTAQSGTGKSTHTSLWMKHIEGVELVNDDNPIIRIIDGKPMLYGSPWSGKTPCYRNVSYPLGAVLRIARAPQNSIERHTPTLAFATLMPACSSMVWDAAVHNNLCDTLTQLIGVTPVYTLHCRPDEEAARLCQTTIAP